MLHNNEYVHPQTSYFPIFCGHDLLLFQLVYLLPRDVNGYVYHCMMLLQYEHVYALFVPVPLSGKGPFLHVVQDNSPVASLDRPVYMGNSQETVSCHNTMYTTPLIFIVMIGYDHESCTVKEKID